VESLSGWRACELRKSPLGRAQAGHASAAGALESGSFAAALLNGVYAHFRI
jgi:hypothetical protein